MIKSMVGQRNFFAERGMKAANLLNSFPVKVNAVHVCYDGALMRAAVSASMFVLQRSHHARIRFHFGELPAMKTVANGVVPCRLFSLTSFPLDYHRVLD